MLVLGIVYPYMLTVRVKMFDSNLKRIRRSRQQAHFYGHWHEDIPLLALKHGFRRVCTMASQSRDGEIIARVLKMIGYRVVRGSSKKGGCSASQEMLQAFRENWDCVLAVDGPKGPRHEIKWGILQLASRAGASIIPTVASAKYRVTFHKSWDRMWVPFPFSPAICILGHEITIPNQASDMVLAEKKEELKRALIFLKNKADSYFG